MVLKLRILEKSFFTVFDLRLFVDSGLRVLGVVLVPISDLRGWCSDR